MMKSKYLLVTALSAAALTACNNDEVLEVNQGRGISFQVATEAATRAAATTTNTINKFKVWGFTDNKTLMDGVEVTKSSGTWSYDNIIFWPASSVDFYSVSPSTVTGVSITNEAQKITGFTVAEKQDEQSTGTGLRVLNQTIQLLNLHNKEAITLLVKRNPYGTVEYPGCLVQISLPDDYSYTLP